MNGKEYQELAMRTNDGNANCRLRQAQGIILSLMSVEYLMHVLDYLERLVNLMT